jgi:predicted TIM-barrel fold metal-dependent hydrolase
MHFGNSDVDLLNPLHIKALQSVFASANGHRMAIVVHMRATVSQKRPYGTAQARAFLNEVLPSAPDVPVQIAHLAGAGGYEDPWADQAIVVFVEAIAARDPRMSKVWFDVSGVAGLGNWKAKADLIAKRIRELGVERVLYGSDGAGGKNPTPRQAWASFLELPLTKDEFRTIASNVAPYMK